MNNKLIKAALIHLGRNMWREQNVTELKFDESAWRDITNYLPKCGFNTLVIDLAEGVKYASHPEIAVKGSWSIEHLREDISRLRSLGLEVVPKFNFSTTHDAWLGEYEHMISTPTYYKVVGDLIREAAEIFDHPRYFHIGFDEEGIRHQEMMPYVVLRQGELWWHDFLYTVKCVEQSGSRAWIWADKYWTEPEEFLKRMPKSVIQSVWYYGQSFDIAELKTHEAEELKVEPRRLVNWKRVQSFLDLDKAGFDQIPCGSNWACDVNIGELVRFCEAKLGKEHRLGYMMAPWVTPTLESNKAKNMKALELSQAAFAQI